MQPTAFNELLALGGVETDHSTKEPAGEKVTQIVWAFLHDLIEKCAEASHIGPETGGRQIKVLLDACSESGLMIASATYAWMY